MEKQYRLLKELPWAPVGTIFTVSSINRYYSLSSDINYINMDFLESYRSWFLYLEQDPPTWDIERIEDWSIDTDKDEIRRAVEKLIEYSPMTNNGLWICFLTEKYELSKSSEI